MLNDGENENLHVPGQAEHGDCLHAYGVPVFQFTVDAVEKIPSSACKTSSPTSILRKRQKFN